MLLGATWVYEGGVMQVRARDKIFRVKDLKGKKIGITKSLNTIKNDWWRIQEHMGIENILMLNDMTMDDIQLVEFPYPDDWYDKPEMLSPMNNPSELWMKRDHKHDYAFRPLEKALLDGYRRRHLQPDGTIRTALGGHGRNQGHLRPVQAPGLDDSGCQHPRCHHLHRRDGQGAPRAGHRLYESHDQGRPLGEREQARGRCILNRQTFYLDAEHTYEGIKHVDMVPSLSAQNLECIKIGKDFMFSHGYIKNDFDVDEWAAPEFLEQAAVEVLKEEWQRRSWSKLPQAAGSRWKARGSGSRHRP